MLPPFMSRKTFAPFQVQQLDCSSHLTKNFFRSEDDEFPTGAVELHHLSASVQIASLPLMMLMIVPQHHNIDYHKLSWLQAQCRPRSNF